MHSVICGYRICGSGGESYYRGVKMKMLITKSTVNSPTIPVINRNHLKTPSPSADYVIFERPLKS